MYRHDRLSRGICMDWCKKQMKHFDYDTRMSYYINNFYNDSSIYMDPNFHTRALVDRARYYRYATQCVNYELKNKYDLMAESQIRYCITNQDNIQRTFGKSTITKKKKHIHCVTHFNLFIIFLHSSITLSLFFCFFLLFFHAFVDTLDLFFVGVCVMIAVLVFLSTSYDFHLKRNNLPHLCNREHYKRSVDGNACK